eukprot:TRINITY_DN718_c0_g2_i1.p1 TRINITY_DN718_c0_g2~~TRINITY_DN718_c0_g2_i1.p1  ORF type:complete len:747 (+),score=118.28 TRINITY_DN718_c0_g2_i1:275-2242(+)
METPKEGNGADCPATPESEACNTDACLNCEGSYGEYGPCSEACGPGTKTRTYTITQEPTGDGTACPPATEETTCNEGPCDVDCEGSYSEWSACDADCGGGTRTQTYTITVQPVANGNVCPPTTRSEACNEHVCPVDCEGSYSEWSDCDVSCGGGVRSKDYTVTTAPVGTGAACPASRVEEACNTQVCDIDCVGKYGPWTVCTAECDGGTQHHNLFVEQEQSGNGAACPPDSETRTCNEHFCDVDCVGEYGPYNACSEECGGGLQYSHFITETEPVANGEKCPDARIERTCNTHDCDTDCVVSEWSDYGDCTKTCGTGEKTRTRTIIVDPVAGGGSCPSLTQTAQCNTHVCDRNCEVSGFGPFSECSVPCGDGYKTRNQTIVVEPAGNGALCPALVESLSCNLKDCDKNCVMSEWAEWSACSVSCGNGSRYRSRYIETNPVGEGDQCGAEIDIDSCGDGRTDCADVDCVLSDYGDWSPCNEECGGGTRSRTRDIVVAAAASGLPCEELTQKEGCNSKLCPVDCEVTNWGVYSECDVECGGGTRTRTREIDVIPRGDGEECPELSQLDPNGCNNQECVVSTTSEPTGNVTTATGDTSGAVVEEEKFMGVGTGGGVVIIILIILVVAGVVAAAVYFLVIKKKDKGDSNDFFLTSTKNI